MRHKATEPAQFVIFGATGDLARRKLLPALCRLADAGQLHPDTMIVGVAPHTLSDREYRSVARDALGKAGLAAETITRFVDDRLRYQPIRQGGPDDFRALGQRLGTLGWLRRHPGAQPRLLPVAATTGIRHDGCGARRGRASQK